jgi:nucleoside-diphosphate-sugar epimerase
MGEVSSAAQLNVSLAMFWDAVLSDAPKTREALSVAWPFCDVRDLAEAHVLALEKQNAGGERILVTAGEWIWQDIRQLSSAYLQWIEG